MPPSAELTRQRGVRMTGGTLARNESDSCPAVTRRAWQPGTEQSPASCGHAACPYTGTRRGALWRVEGAGPALETRPGGGHAGVLQCRDSWSHAPVIQAIFRMGYASVDLKKWKR